jgi:NADH:ubiquinone oxidoreductase subunit 5 (subunit L)/multisubunit Na+/H+ antiporter MnhA subunit
MHSWASLLFQCLDWLYQAIFPDLYVLGIGWRVVLSIDRLLLRKSLQQLPPPKKAFIVTRFADLGFLIGILILAF